MTLVCELQGKIITQGGSSRKVAVPDSSEQFPRQKSRSTDFNCDLNRANFDLCLQEVSSKYYGQD